MADKKQYHRKNHQQENKPPTEAPHAPKASAENNPENPTNPANNGQRYKNRLIHIGKALWNKDNQPQFQNIIALGALAIAIWLAIVTYWVFKVAAEQSDSVEKSGNAAKQSAQIAQNTFDMTKRYNDSVSQAQKITNRKSDSTDSVKSKLQENSLNAQITAIEIAKNEFESVNDPVLQAGNFIATFDENGIAKIKYDIINLGKQYVKVVSIKSGVATTNFILSYNEVDSLLKSKDVTKTPFNGYIGTMPFHMGKTMPTKYTSFEKYGKFIFFTVVGEIYYFNPISKKHKTYRFADKINEMGEINYTTIVDFNK